MQEYFLQQVTADMAQVLPLRCPHCRQRGMFEPVDKVNDMRWTQWEDGSGELTFAGIRMCPDENCGGFVFVVYTGAGLIESFPPETIDFDPAGIPTEILDLLQEAIICHSVGAYRSASIMVRRALEELCKAQGAKGNNLKDRIAALGQKIVVPKDLLDATDELRILGNDAAHVEAKSYDAMDAQTSELAIEVAKELLKAVYQHVNLVAKLKALRKGP